MESKLFNAMVKDTNHTTTENGMSSFKSTLNSCLDLFGNVGAMRNSSEVKITSAFDRAAAESFDLALMIVFWARDIRGGAGEREVFRVILKHVANTYHDIYPDTWIKIIEMTVKVGRWDDVLVLLDSRNQVAKEAAVISIAAGLHDNNCNQLCAKWMPRKGKTAAILRKEFHMTPKSYRKMLVRLSNTVETKMCANDWDNIEYGKVPSLAAARYQRAFARHDPIGYKKYRNGLVSGTEKINSSAVYPYDVFKSAMTMGGDAIVANAQWEALPNYMEGSEDVRILPLVDVSGSMNAPISYKNATVSCMSVAVSLGMYVAERNESFFKNKFISFSRNPELHNIVGKDIRSKINNIVDTEWGMNTDIQKVFELILNSALKNNLSQEDMPNIILIFSDMEFDRADLSSRNESIYDLIDDMYENVGYERPKIVYWNLRATNDFPVECDANGSVMVSGFSPSIMKSVLKMNLDSFSPLNMMLETVYVSRYDIKGKVTKTTLVK